MRATHTAVVVVAAAVLGAAVDRSEGMGVLPGGLTRPRASWLTRS